MRGARRLGRLALQAGLPGQRMDGGREHDEIELMDVATGTKKLFTAISNADNSVVSIGNWASNLGSL